MKSQARLGYFIQAFPLPIGLLSDLEEEVKFTLLIAALNDAACAQLRKGDSDDLNDHPLRTHTHAHTHS